MPEDGKLGDSGKVIRWLETPKCTECDYRDRAADRCRLQRCRYKEKQEDERAKIMRIVRYDG